MDPSNVKPGNFVDQFVPDWIRGCTLLPDS